MRHLITTLQVLVTAIFFAVHAQAQIVIIDKTPLTEGRAMDVGPPVIPAVPVRCLPEGQVFIGPSNFKWRLVLTVGKIGPIGNFVVFDESNVSKVAINTPTPPMGLRWRSQGFLNVNPEWAGEQFCQAELQVSLTGHVWFSRLDVGHLAVIARRLGVPEVLISLGISRCPGWAIFDKNGSRTAHRELK